MGLNVDDPARGGCIGSYIIRTLSPVGVTLTVAADYNRMICVPDDICIVLR